MEVDIKTTTSYAVSMCAGGSYLTLEGNNFCVGLGKETIYLGRDRLLAAVQLLIKEQKENKCDSRME